MIRYGGVLLCVSALLTPGCGDSLSGHDVSGSRSPTPARVAPAASPAYRDQVRLGPVEPPRARTEPLHAVQGDVPRRASREYDIKSAMVQPDVSGLHNPDFLRAAGDFGIRYVVSDTSRRSGHAPATARITGAREPSPWPA